MAFISFPQYLAHSMYPINILITVGYNNTLSSSLIYSPLAYSQGHGVLIGPWAGEMK